MPLGKVFFDNHHLASLSQVGANDILMRTPANAVNPLLGWSDLNSVAFAPGWATRTATRSAGQVVKPATGTTNRNVSKVKNFNSTTIYGFYQDSAQNVFRVFTHNLSSPTNNRTEVAFSPNFYLGYIGTGQTNPAVGDTYTHNGNTYTVRNATGSGELSVVFERTSGTGEPNYSSATFTRATGSGAASLTFAVTNLNPYIIIDAHAVSTSEIYLLLQPTWSSNSSRMFFRVLRTTNFGAGTTWSSCGAPLLSYGGEFGHGKCAGITANGTGLINVVAGTSTHLYHSISTDNGSNWTDSIIANNTIQGGRAEVGFSADSTKILTAHGTAGGVRLSYWNGSSWSSRALYGTNSTDFVPMSIINTSGATWYIAGHNVTTTTGNTRILKTTDDGSTVASHYNLVDGLVAQGLVWLGGSSFAFARSKADTTIAQAAFFITTTDFASEISSGIGELINLGFAVYPNGAGVNNFGNSFAYTANGAYFASYGGSGGSTTGKEMGALVFSSTSNFLNLSGENVRRIGYFYADVTPGVSAVPYILNGGAASVLSVGMRVSNWNLNADVAPVLLFCDATGKPEVRVVNSIDRVGIGIRMVGGGSSIGTVIPTFIDRVHYDASTASDAIFYFRVTSGGALPAAGETYTNNSSTFTVVNSFATGYGANAGLVTTRRTSGSNYPTATSGVLTRATGSVGAATLNYATALTYPYNTALANTASVSPTIPEGAYIVVQFFKNSSQIRVYAHGTNPDGSIDKGTVINSWVAALDAVFVTELFNSGKRFLCGFVGTGGPTSSLSGTAFIDNLEFGYL